MNIETDDLINILTEQVKKAKHSILIVSPYIKLQTAKIIIDIVKNKQIDLKLLTIPPGEEYITGATDLEAILTLQSNGFEIKMLPSLHAKIYLLDKKVLLLGSANFTNKGLGIADDPNKEIMIKKEATKDDLTFILDNFWNHEEVHTIDQYHNLEGKVNTLKDRFEQFLKQKCEFNKVIADIFRPTSPHEQLLIRLKDKGLIQNFTHLKSGFYKHSYLINDKQGVKVTRSKEGANHQQKNFEVFSYQITKKSAELFLNRKLRALILILEEPEQFVCLPTSFLIDKVLRKSYAGKDKGYQFKIKRDGEELYLSVKGKSKVQIRDIKKYEGEIHFKILK